MTDNNHPITPPPELVQKWQQKAKTIGGYVMPFVFATRAAQWGADQELEACCKWLHWQNLATHPDLIPSFRAARRPKPPSLKEQALQALDLAALAESEPEGPTLDEIDDLCAEHSFCYEDSESLECLLLIITDALARWGK